MASDWGAEQDFIRCVRHLCVLSALWALRLSSSGPTPSPLWPAGHGLPRNEIIPEQRCQEEEDGEEKWGPGAPRLPSATPNTPPTLSVWAMPHYKHTLSNVNTHTPTHTRTNTTRIMQISLLCFHAHTHTHTHTLCQLCPWTDYETTGTWTQTCKSPHNSKHKHKRHTLNHTNDCKRVCLWNTILSFCLSLVVLCLFLVTLLLFGLSASLWTFCVSVHVLRHYVVNFASLPPVLRFVLVGLHLFRDMFHLDTGLVLTLCSFCVFLCMFCIHVDVSADVFLCLCGQFMCLCGYFAYFCHHCASLRLLNISWVFVLLLVVNYASL